MTDQPCAHCWHRTGWRVVVVDGQPDQRVKYATSFTGTAGQQIEDELLCCHCGALSWATDQHGPWLNRMQWEGQHD